MEFGTRHGAKLLFMAKVLQLIPIKVLKYLALIFEGLRTFSSEDGNASTSMEGGYIGDEQVLRKAIDFFGMEEWVHIVKGDARITIPAFNEAFPCDGKFCLYLL